MTAGRPTKFEERYVEEAERLAMLGLTDKQMAAFWEVTEQTVNNWKTAHPEFFEALKRGKTLADAQVVQSLYRRANGYSHDAVKIHWDKDGREYRAAYVEHYPPDATSAIFWLKNRQPELWRDKIETTQKLVDENDQPVSGIELARRIAFAFAQAGAMTEAPASPPTKH